MRMVVTGALPIVMALALADGSHAFQVPRSTVRSTSSSSMTSRVSSTVVASLMAREGQLVLLVLWRGSTAWLQRGPGGSSSGGSGRGTTWMRSTEGGVTLNVDIDDTARTAEILGQRLSLRDVNVVLVDLVDTKPAIVGTRRIDADIPRLPEATYVVVKREPELLDFLQCDLMRTDPLYQKLRPDYLKAMMAVHPCGG